MNITELTLRLLLLFFPGIICFYVVDALIVHRERQTYQVFLFSYVYGLLSYCVFATFHLIYVTIIGATINRETGSIQFPIPGAISFSRSLTDPNVTLDFLEITFVTVVAIAVGFCIAYAVNHKWLYKAAKRFNVTKKFGDLDVWSFAFNTDEVRWATVRDLTHNFMFTGYVRAFSDVEESAELILTDVIAYNETTGAELYRADRLYLSRKKDDLTIEFPTAG